MRINGFDWDEENLGHIARHGVWDYEVEEAVLFGRPVFQKTHSNRYLAHGITQNGRYLLVVFIVKGSGIIRVITARNMTNKEKHNYRKRKVT